MKCDEGYAEVTVGGVEVRLICLNWHETNRKVKKFAFATPRFRKLYWYNQIEALVTTTQTWVVYMGFKCGRILCAIWESRYRYFLKLTIPHLPKMQQTTPRFSHVLSSESWDHGTLERLWLGSVTSE
jgi:hypothetical protein